MTSSTDNDAAIAQALAREEQERADADLARLMETQLMGSSASNGRTSTIVQGRNVAVNCPGHHGLNEFRVSYAQRVHCDYCHKIIPRDETAFGCLVCDFDICQACKQRGGPPTPTTEQSAPRRGNGNNNNSMVPFPFQARAPDTHMCIAPCVIGNQGVCVEMMVDTGAQTSVMSLPLAKQLGLERRIDRSQQGVAAGVGRARIIGRIRHVACELGHVEFPMDFIVLDVSDKILLLGLDLMRKYKCIVDLESDVLVFGGKGGVEVHMLPANEQHMSLRNSIGCPMM